MTAAASLCLALVCAAPARPAADFVQRQGAGRPEVVLARRDTPTGTLVVTFAAGIYDDGDKPGLTRLAQVAMLSANTRARYEALLTDVYEAGAQLELETGVRECSVALTAPKASFERLARTVLDLAFRPQLDLDEIKNAIRRSLVESPRLDSSVTLSALLARSVFPDEWRFQNELFADRDALERISSTDLEKHFEEKLTPGNARVVMVGPFDQGKMAKQLKKYSGGKRARTVRPTAPLPVSVHYRSRSNVRLMAFPLKLRGPVDVAQARVLAALLEDRLFRRLRGQGVAYSVASQVHHTEWLDFLMVVLPTGEKTEVASGSLLAELASLREKKFTEEDLATNRDHVLAQMERASRDSARLANALSMGGADFPWHSEATREAVAAVTVDQVAALAAGVLTAENTLDITYSPKDSRLGR